MIIADENVEKYLIDLLKNKGFEVLSIKEKYAGIKDLEIVNLIKTTNGILLTEDKDFGEFVFAHFIRGLSVILLRYDQPRYELIEDNLLTVAINYHNNIESVFITITQHKIRVRKI